MARTFRVLHLAHCAALALLAGTLSACGPEGSSEASSPALAPVSTRAVAAAATPNVCQGTGAHDKHGTLPTGCQTCHPCGGTFGLVSGATLPSSRPISGTVTHDATGTSCSVTCHTPAGQQTPTPITWTTAGPLACSGCHAHGQPAAAGGSSHPSDLSNTVANRTACQSCHELSAHVTGTVRIQTPTTIVSVPPGGGPTSTAVNDACMTCHLGTGNALAGKTPPLVVGWSDTTSAGDWHGARVGTGSGGTIASPYARGQATLACTACHASHESANPYLFVASANGQAVAAATITRAGVGAEQVCTGCHVGARHQYCIGCHGVDPQPAGSACFACHGHEGIRGFPWPTTPVHTPSRPPPPNAPGDCGHCHNPGWAPVPETVPPVVSAIQVSGFTAASATVSWTTNEAASSFVEFGPTGPGFIQGNGALVKSHTVMLTGLTGNTTYQFRVRSADQFRNVTESAIATFTTADPYAPTAPLLDPGPSYYTLYDTFTYRYTWSTSSPPSGNPAQYRIQFDTNPNFVAPADSGWISTPYYTATLNTLVWPDQYFMRVQARDSVNLATSPWSASSSFFVWYQDW